MNLGIVGYGELGKAVARECIRRKNVDLIGVFSRRDMFCGTQKGEFPFYPPDSLEQFEKRIDLLILCGSSYADLPVLSPVYAEKFNIVDSFDDHGNIPAHFRAVDNAAQRHGRIALISAGWDPGILSYERLLWHSFLPEGVENTFWGPGVSQGHSNVLRTVPGVADAVQFTVPETELIRRCENGCAEHCSCFAKHKRVCYISTEKNADRDAIVHRIGNIPGYFKGYCTEICFVDQVQIDKMRNDRKHSGLTVTSCNVEGNCITAEFNLRTTSNPFLTACVLMTYASALYKKFLAGERGCKTVFDFSPNELAEESCSDGVFRFL